MKHNKKVNIYLVEGHTEEKAIRLLKEKYIISGKVYIIHQKLITDTLLRMLKKASNIIMIFDTDTSETYEIVKKNIETLQKHKLKVVLIPQVKNFEDEIIYATDIKNIKELLNSKSKKDFKNNFRNTKNVLEKLEKHHFNIEKFWSRSPEKPSCFSEFKNDGNKIKK
ncbi:MAG: hypothetical protein ACTTKH_01425 [Treponema sp.]